MNALQMIGEIQNDRSFRSRKALGGAACGSGYSSLVSHYVIVTSREANNALQATREDARA